MIVTLIQSHTLTRVRHVHKQTHTAVLNPKKNCTSSPLLFPHVEDECHRHDDQGEDGTNTAQHDSQNVVYKQKAEERANNHDFSPDVSRL